MKFNYETNREAIKPNTLKSEHLKDEFSPIMVSVGSKEQHLSGLDLALEMDRLWRIAVNIRYGESYSDLSKKGFKNDGERTYVISTIDERPKRSGGFINCTGCIVVGVDKATGKNISFLSHQDPFYFTEDGVLNFMEDLSDSLLEMKERSIESSVDVIVVGGNILDTKYKGKTYENYYKDSIELISTLVEKRLGFLPVISTKAKANRGFDSVLFDTKERRAYLIRETFIKKDDNEPYLFDKNH